VATKKTEEDAFPEIGDDDDNEEVQTRTRTRTATMSRNLSMMSGDALRAVLERAPAASTAAMPIIPEVKAPRLEDIHVVVPEPEPVSSEQIAGAFYVVRRDFAKTRDRKEGEKVAMGDDVLVDIVGYSGGKLLPMSTRQGVWMELSPDDNLPGFMEGVAGNPVGESCVVDVDLPGDYPVSGYAGLPATFAVIIHEAKEVKMPGEKDPKFLKEAGLGSSLSQAMDTIRASLEEEQVDQLIESGRELVKNGLAARVEVDLTETLIDEEIRRRWMDSEGRLLAELGVEFAEQERCLDAWKADKDTQFDVIRSLRVSMALGAIAQRDGLEVTVDLVNSFLQSIADASGLQMEGLAKAAQDDRNLQRHMSDKLLAMLAFEHVMMNVDVTYEGADG
jgi:trigger factor